MMRPFCISIEVLVASLKSKWISGLECLKSCWMFGWLIVCVCIGLCSKTRWSTYKNIREVFIRHISYIRTLHVPNLLSIPLQEWTRWVVAVWCNCSRIQYESSHILLQRVDPKRYLVWFQSLWTLCYWNLFFFFHCCYEMSRVFWSYRWSS